MSKITGSEQPAVVLLAEDNEADQHLARRVLARGVLRCDLRIVPNGEDALAYLRGQGAYADRTVHPQPHLLLLDLHMPRKNGIEVLQAVKQDPALKSIPTVMLTTSGADEDLVGSYAAGCNSFVQKPVDLPEFISALEQLGVYWLKLVALPPVRASSQGPPED